MTQPYGIIKAQKFDIQGNSIAGEPNNNDWRLVVDNELYKLKYYDSSNQTFSTLETIDTSGNVTIPGNLQIVGALNVSGNSGFSGMVCSFVGERNSTSNTAGIAFSFGNGSTAIHGPTMPVAGKVIGMTFSSTVNCYCEIELWINNSATGKVLECGTYTFGGPPPSGSNYWEYTYAKTAKTTSVNKTFNAEDRIQIKIKAIDGTKTGEYSDRGTESNTGTISYPVATFFIKYD